MYINYKLCNVHKNSIFESLKEAVESSRKILINRVEKRKKEKYRFRKQEKKNKLSRRKARDRDNGAPRIARGYRVPL